MKNINCVVHFDLLGEFDHEKECCEHCWEVWSSDHPELTKQVAWTFVDNTASLHERIPGADFVFVDYGGLAMPGHERLGMSFARALEKCVIEHPSIEFIILCTMGKEWYGSDFTEDHINLYFENRDWFALFDRYLGGANA
jgi:hypothetical protein